jgi:hypothetical protein
MAKAGKPTGPTSLQFFGRLKWLDGTPLLDTIEPYRREIFRLALDSYGPDGRPLYSLVLSGRGKKNAKSLDLILAALFVLIIRRSVQGSDGIIAASDEGQANDDLSLAKKLVACNPNLRAEITPLAKSLQLKDGSGSLKIIAARDDAGAHGKTYGFLGVDELHTARDWSLLEALAPDPTRPDALQWITSYASMFHAPGAPLHDLMQTGRAGSDKRMLFSWYSGDLCTDPDFADLPSPEQRANPSMQSWADGEGYLAQQRARLPFGRYRRLHLNLPGAPEGAALAQDKILACVVPGRRSLQREPGRRYFAAVDMSGGSNDDACLAIAHAEGKVAVLDLVAKQIGSPPFDPRAAVANFCNILDEWKIHRVSGDAYGGETFRADFAGRGKTYDLVEDSKSEAYEKLEPALNAREVELLDHSTLIEQTCSLIWRGAKIDHEPGGHDDHINAAALAINIAHAPAIDWGPIANAVSQLGPYRGWHGGSGASASGFQFGGERAAAQRRRTRGRY